MDTRILYKLQKDKSILSLKARADLFEEVGDLTTARRWRWRAEFAEIILQQLKLEEEAEAKDCGSKPRVMPFRGTTFQFKHGPFRRITFRIYSNLNTPFRWFTIDCDQPVFAKRRPGPYGRGTKIVRFEKHVHFRLSAIDSPEREKECINCVIKLTDKFARRKS